VFVRAFPNGASFDPEDIEAMSLAFDDLCKALSLGETDELARQDLAARVIALAAAGERNPDRLRDRLLRARV
jgi:hypothetical protein